MTTPALRIVYTNGKESVGTVRDWACFRAEGVDLIVVGDQKFYGHAIYWLYYDQREGGMWVVGMASTYCSPPPPETLFRPNGTVVTREIVTMPDLRHAQVKLGWWRKVQDYIPGRIKS